MTRAALFLGIVLQAGCLTGSGFSPGLAAGAMNVAATPAQPSNIYRVTVTRRDANLYRIDGESLFIVTKYCYEYATSEQAILRYTRGALDNKLIFDKRYLETSCEVTALVK